MVLDGVTLPIWPLHPVGNSYVCSFSQIIKTDFDELSINVAGQLSGINSVPSFALPNSPESMTKLPGS